MQISRERKPKGTRRKLPLVGAVAAGGAASWASWTAPAPARGGLGLLLLAVSLAVGAGLLVRSWWHRTPFNLEIRVPWALSVRARMGEYQRPFLGWSRGFLGESRWAMGTEEDSVGVVGPPGVNKTSGIGIAQALMWGGALVSVSQTPLILRETLIRRFKLARRSGGHVIIYAPTEAGFVEGLRPVRFSPSSSSDPTEIGLRVESWLAATGTAKGLQDFEHFRAGAGAILRGCFLADAHHPTEPGNFALVRKWLSSRNLADPIAILQSLNTKVGDQWAEELEGIEHSPAEREREGFFSSALTTIGVTSNPNVLASTAVNELDAESFLLSGSTLYIVSPTEHQKMAAPLIAMLVDHLVRTAYRLHREGRLPARFLLSLDDLANVCPLPSLESIISQGRGQGVNVAWSLQSLAQLRDHYGVEAAEAIWSATRCKIVFGGLSDEQTLERTSAVIPDERVVVPGLSETDKGPKGSKHIIFRRLLSAGQLREIPSGWALLLYLNQPPRMLRQPLAEKRWQLKWHMIRWAPGRVAVPLVAEPVVGRHGAPVFIVVPPTEAGDVAAEG
ncbi:TraM recognition domain-containing protein [Candidatus Nephthysia bennettiae]|uniref:TraM recognition domain-containing protein n=1 Tax=Candidatus Nephthysia bennettiae TaxID=3127016 RepID=A0A934K913_9BACT|nr:TraM recognition domain-containing protein [Candidatus Dormibacteraeota bacterium]MBJ7607125.1 TraM recognition domain-containing protein [Candidatus Dormibacteraeota bacterium]MBJ7613686.1 TraM recognition domain-containing protein [Candidatus Dormibacteraeota bacterium]